MGMHMLDWSPYFISLYAMLGFALLGWVISLFRKKVSHVDTMWSLFFLLAGLTTAYLTQPLSSRASIVLILLGVWSVRLAGYITWRNKGHEDARYEVIRQNNQPYFSFKSLYIVFGFQAVLAWIISIVLFANVQSQMALSVIDLMGMVVVLFGLIWEAVADWQLTQFKANPAHQGKVMDKGLWRYSRHPNYFGECCVWWGFYLFALAIGAWWAMISPILMTVLLLKVSGVSLLESTIVNRRPAYAQYIAQTNAFIPGPKKHD